MTQKSNKEPREKKPHGRPKIELTDKQIEQLGIMSGLGMTLMHMSLILGFGKDTLENMAKTDERVFSALEKGRGNSAANVMKTAYQMAVSGSHPIMTIFWLKTRARWREKSEPIDELADIAGQSHIEAPPQMLTIDVEKQMPTFVVEMNESGKFVRARPREVLLEENRKKDE